MKWRYAVSFANMKPGWTVDQIKKDMENYRAEVEKAGIKLVFWGHPVGTSENLMAVYDVGGDMDKWLKIMGSPPYESTKTHFVVEH